MFNLYYIRAKIQEDLGIDLTLDETKVYLIASGLATYAQLKQRTFTGYDAYYNTVYVKETRTKHRD